MGAIKRIVKFGTGGVVGAAVGSAAALLLAPRSGDELQATLRDRLRRAKLAGAEAEAETADALIRRFRAEVSDPNALETERVRTRDEVAEAARLVGLGLNAPGAIAAQQADDRRR